MPRIVKLINVSDSNNNKEYFMIENPDGATWTAKWGRVGYDKQEQIYPMSDWNKKYKEKIGKKGYSDITDLVSVQKSDGKDDEPRQKKFEIIKIVLSKMPVSI